MNATPANNQRKYSRVPLAMQVDLHLPGQRLRVELLDIALKGALVRTFTGLNVDLHAPCRLVLVLAEGEETIEMRGQVAHLEPEQLGMACDAMELQSLTNLRRLLALNTGDAELMDRELAQLFARPNA